MRHCLTPRSGMFRRDICESAGEKSQEPLTFPACFRRDSLYGHLFRIEYPDAFFSMKLVQIYRFPVLHGYVIEVENPGKGRLSKQGTATENEQLTHSARRKALCAKAVGSEQ